MYDIYNEILNYTDHELLVCITIFTCGLFTMRVCQWIYVTCKWIHDWLSSMFPTSIDRS